MNAALNIINILSIPLVILNWLAPIAAIIWLAILGQWGIIAYGVALWIVGVYALGLAMMPGTIFFSAIGSMLNRYQLGTRLAGFLGLLNVFFVLSCWCLFNLWLLLADATPTTLIPILLWFYSIATNPIGFLASKDLQSGDVYAIISTFFAKFAAVMTMAGILMLDLKLIHAMLIFGSIMFFGLTLEFKAAIDKEARPISY